ncbi:hypothetical protein D9Q98_009737 [Chlorella vulgaris]|uniref:DNA-directed RNA polymerase III subunit RPC10 n=1 Tax=Chlorella vulgaris TaxID=3077 RepID=A0A9D4TEZ4_CHLVU|nr:hypothetical protein D9Q98_009737 [Chlorella vulgaris]
MNKCKCHGCNPQVSDGGAASCAELDGGKFCVNVLKAAPSLLDFTSLFDHLASCTATFNLLLLSLTGCNTQGMGSGLLFCPTCGNLLLVESHGGGDNIYACQTCPYLYYIDRTITKGVPLTRKQVEPVLGGDEEWKNAARTQARCPNDACRHDQAYFQEVQIRSADEPATLFFRCTKCAVNWREG